MFTAENCLHRMYEAPYLSLDPGDTKTIYPRKQFATTPVVTTGVEARTLEQPHKTGMIHTVVLDTDGGTLTLTVTGGYNGDADTSITFADAGDFVTFISIRVGSSFYWRVLGQEGTNVAAVLADTMTPGAGWVAGITNPNVYNIYLSGGIIKTEILIDMTGLNGTGTAADIIGDDGAVTHSHFGRITATVNGTLFGGRMSCLETPAGGNVDVDFWSGIEDDGQNDEPIATELTGEIQHLNHGAWAAGEIAGLTSVPAADMYLYLSPGASTDADFSAGIFFLEMWGTAP